MAGYELHDDGLRPEAHDRAIRHFAEPTSVVCYCRQPHDEATDQEEDIAPGRAEPSEAGIEQAVVLLDLLQCMIEDDEEIRDRPRRYWIERYWPLTAYPHFRLVDSAPAASECR
jgi:hypothetical protein